MEVLAGARIPRCSYELGTALEARIRDRDRAVRALRRALNVIVSIEEPELIERILAHRRERGEEAPTTSLGARAPPQRSLF
jgi:hypothetical protein